MVQIIPQEGLAEMLGQNLGGGISSGMQMLIQSKLKSMAEREKLNRLQSLLGLPSHAAAPTEEIVRAEEITEAPAPLKPASVPAAAEQVAMPARIPEISDEQILAISTIDPQMAKLLQTQKESRTKAEAAKFKETRDIRKDVLAQQRAAKETDMRLDRMDQLNKEGKLVTPLYNTALKKLGLDVAVLKNPASEEYDKLSNDMFRNIREIFGARITNLEVSAFLKTIPTLSNTPKGRERIISNLKKLNKGAELRAQEMRKIIKENQGVPPYDLAEQIEERVGPKLDKLSVDFIKGPIQEQKEIQFSTMPKADQYPNKIITDTVSGKRYKSDGKTWKVIK